MTQNQKILIGVGLLGLGYLLWKNSKKSTQVADSGNGTTDSGNGLSEIGSAYGYDTPYMPQAKPEIGSAYMDVLIPKGTKIEGAKVRGYGVSFITDKVNKYDYGIGQAKFGEFDVTSIVSNEREDPAPFEQPKVVNGYSLYIGNIVNVVLTKDVVRSVPTKLIIIN